MWAIAFVFIVSASLQPTYAAIPKHPMEKSSIQYPKPINQEVEEIPDSCKDLTYCTVKPKDYPEDKFNVMFKDYKALPQPTMVVELKNRQGEPDSTDNCESEVTYEPLYKVRRRNDEPWRTVIQAPSQDFIQRVRLERCLNPNAPCFKNISPVQEFVSFCRQKVNVWQVLVSKGDDETEMIKAELPMCCSCYYKELDFKTRFVKPKK
ncbi:uncharacterized protein LOC126769171 isoform X10 [Nymphalis io]|uniref:uncharacterized protein LOC126769171 isoform X7 n=1 Tax=Inachis io TaxID=171585 RepID=UPI00216AB0AF|nr:uncharacterized protein LOC126769171 isoform X7 [Nymphalis io]XP_050343763.1 uncharacterized protein LOC126769171 isoform X8 [Nymphalis io]XP_050343765.1 uncharacterized protein LOC126769171 isoform X9 [Nymphalis io]XP_050343766.1 uncharacterized protein LOC126769171 isoform X10 [Nymphalis io]